ncbi:hypothetical protein Pmar_PMAR027176 [Perkinsus marinus ATCC 50983]|uniref:Uncharacterized protein n=1 Tax=Perkinsus marinus (strain ATCC 50983 / TXsc) TaxID=423536 RepID=C5LGS1_PERM5|nr:hypothetical protein Pmar_PMAR027176 [Perkinsus marinus ATCC 50983]EER04072.1 hypothetical protein Pmar_PMAR027176 [Perkinsus marinus ATCC 50983]|eukprot:XP_002772256.1 hypothetical protein Pmar_PMAR027176 [Perkinsus marinus ATCC 50983]
MACDHRAAGFPDHSMLDLALSAAYGLDETPPPVYPAGVPGRALEQRLSSLSARGQRPGLNNTKGSGRSGNAQSPGDQMPLPPKMMTFLSEVGEVVTKLQPLLHRMRALRASYPGVPAFAVEITDLVRGNDSDKLFVTVNGGVGRVFVLLGKNNSSTTKF